MVSYKYLPIDYYTYNRPEFVGAILLGLLFFSIFGTLLHILSYEYYDAQDKCTPNYYYSKGCQNQNSRALLFNPNFMNFKKVYYEIIGKYNPLIREYEGVKKSTYNNQNRIEESEKMIDENIKSNEDFMEKSINEIKNLTEIANTITSEYLANIHNFVENIRNAPKEVVDSLNDLPNHLEELKGQINSTISNPTLSHYTAPLKKLYRSLTEVNDKTKSYISNDN
jgi:hypothetical protein